jgi:hypothetical protein
MDNEVTERPERQGMSKRVKVFLAALLVAVLGVGADALHEFGQGAQPQIAGIVWQPDNATVGIQGEWQKLGAHQLLVQWTAVDRQAFVADAGLRQVSVLPDWSRIGKEPWAQDVIVGLAGFFNENQSRDNVEELATLSETLAKVKLPLNVIGWYFPAEVDPSWSRANELPTLLARLPRPLWISVYDGANIGPEATANWLKTWLPDDIGVFFQDGVGVYARTAPVARTYVDALRKKLGKNRVKVIAEAFRPQVGGGFRSATADELKPQIAAYSGYSVYLFDGPHYVTPKLIEGLLN